MKILDSDHCIAVLRGMLDLRDFSSGEMELAVTAVSLGELTHGAHKSNRMHENLAALDVLMAGMTLVPFDGFAARRFGALKARLERRGARLADADLQIASIALAHKVPLVTHNSRHFERIGGLDLEDWLGPRRGARRS